jgi:hypothetical protein
MEQSTAEVAGEADTAEASPTRPWRKLAWWAGVAAYVAAGVTLFFCYRWLSETQPVTSDGAANALQAWAMLHGDPLLRGWTVGDVSFYTTELPEYMGVELIRGLGPDVVHVAAAFTYTLLVLLAGLLAKGRARGREALVRVLIASGIMIAPQLHFGASIVLLGADHTGTEVPLLATWLVLDRAPRRWYVPLIVTVMLAWAQVADSIALLVAIAPLAVVCVLRICYALVRRKSPRVWWYEVALAVAAVASVYLAEFAVHVIQRLGGYTPIGLPTLPAILSTVPDHLRLTGEGVLVLYGADFSGLHPGVAAAFAAVHLVGLALVVWAFGLAIWRFFRNDDIVVQVLTVAIVINLAAFALSRLPGAIYTFRQIVAVLPLGAVLAGRLLSGPVMRLKLVPALAVILACYAAALGYSAAQPAVPAQDQALADWLVAHHLSTGLTGWNANTLTLDTDGRVQLLPTFFGWSGAAPDVYQSKDSFYDPGLNYANFAVTTPAGAPDPLTYRIAVADFGRPARIYQFGGYTIMTWDKNLLADLGAPRTQ